MLNLAAEPQIDSIVDGDGLRTVIWFQGCEHNCPHCHNPSTHSFEPHLLMSVDDVVDFYLKQDLQAGITLSGGDPFFQAEELLVLLKSLKKYKINVWCYTGFTYDFLLKTYKEHLQFIDVLIDGLYINELRDTSLKFRGSSNQRLIDVPASLNKHEIVLWDE